MQQVKRHVFPLWVVPAVRSVERWQWPVGMMHVGVAAIRNF